MLCIMACVANAETEATVCPWSIQIHYDTAVQAAFDFNVPADISLVLDAHSSVTETYTDFLYVGGILFNGTITVKKPAKLKITGLAGSYPYTKTLVKGSNRISDIDGPFIENFNNQRIMQIYITIEYIDGYSY